MQRRQEEAHHNKKGGIDRRAKTFLEGKRRGVLLSSLTETSLISSETGGAVYRYSRDVGALSLFMP